LLFELGQLDRAREELEKALELARALGHRRLEATTLCNLGMAMRALGQPDAALKHIERSVTLAEELKAPKTEGVFRGYLGELLGELGQPEAAIMCFSKAEKLIRSVGDSASLALLYCQCTACAIHSGDGKAAAISLRQAEETVASLALAPDAELARALKRSRDLFSQRYSK